ncbi:MAG: efflux RND transporter periplasmic adaptor subunit [Gudongella sp.]|nr:efflux RND transporter periplasmic adaptor subunit [Gudongella sp.]
MNKKKYIILITTLVIAFAISGCSSNQTDEVEEENYTPVEICTTQSKDIDNEVSFSGKILANEEIFVIPKASGIVTAVNFELGDKVNKGDILFTIEKDDISNSVAQASNGISLAQKGVSQAENGLASAKINYELNKEKIENAILNYERTKELYEQGAVSKSQLEQAEIAANTMNLDAIKAGVTQAEISYQQSLNQLTQAQISYEQAANGIDNTQVEAPMTGILSTLNVKTGQIAGSGQQAATIVDVSEVYIQLSVVESVVNDILEGDEIRLEIPAAATGEITSTVSYVSPSADPMNKLYTVKSYINNPDSKIRPGMSAKAIISLEKAEDAIVIPSNSIINEGDKKFVFVVEDDIAIEKEVTTGIDTGEFVEILSGLNFDEKIIIEGQFYVSDGSKVKVVVRGE